MVNQKVINSPPFLYHLPILSFSLILIPKTSLTLISNSISNYAFDFISILTFLRQRSLEHDGSVIITLLSIFLHQFSGFSFSVLVPCLLLSSKKVLDFSRFGRFWFSNCPLTISFAARFCSLLLGRTVKKQY